MNQQGAGPYGGVQPESTIQPEPPAQTVVPGYFGAATPPPGYVAPAHVPAPPAPQFQARQMPPPVQPYAAPPLYRGATDPKSQPLRPATFMQAIGRFYAKYATFSGRASRSEYWWVAAAMAGLFLAGAVLNAVTGADWVAGSNAVIMLGSVVPGIAVTFRRLHDANMSGGLAFLALVPYVGALVVAILTLMPGRVEGARFDKEAAGAP